MKDDKFEVLAVPGKPIVLTGQAAKKLIEELKKPLTKEQKEFLEKCRESAKLFKMK